jgi:hypothetical protein
MDTTFRISELILGVIVYRGIVMHHCLCLIQIRQDTIHINADSILMPIAAINDSLYCTVHPHTARVPIDGNIGIVPYIVSEVKCYYSNIHIKISLNQCKCGTSCYHDCIYRRKL